MKRFAGFSLVEVIISAALVATTVGALFAAASMAIRLSMASQDRLIASQIAREGIEAVRQIRDSNFVVDQCGIGVPQCHPTWTTGILSGGESLPLTGVLLKQLTPTTGGTVPFTLTTVNNSSQNTCTDYLIRDTRPGFGGITYGSSSSTLAPNQELFCRRIFIEPVTTSDLAGNAIRVRSQVAWLGTGKTALRTFGTLLQPNSQACPGLSSTALATEWCTEQVMLLTDWRQQ